MLRNFSCSSSTRSCALWVGAQAEKNNIRANRTKIERRKIVTSRIGCSLVQYMYMTIGDIYSITSLVQLPVAFCSNVNNLSIECVVCRGGYHLPAARFYVRGRMVSAPTSYVAAPKNLNTISRLKHSQILDGQKISSPPREHFNLEIV